MPDLSYKSVGAVAEASGAGAINVPQPALASGDIALLVMFDSGTTTAPTVTGYTALTPQANGTGGAFFIFWRRATGTIAATNVSVPFVSGGWAKIGVSSGSAVGIVAPTVLAYNELAAVSYWQTPALTVTDRLAWSLGWITAARTQGTLSNQGTITSTNTSRAFDTLAGPGHRVETATSAVTSSSAGAVRGTFTGGATTTITLTIVLPNNPGAAAGTATIVSTAFLTATARLAVTGTAPATTAAFGAIGVTQAVGGFAAATSSTTGTVQTGQPVTGTVAASTTATGAAQLRATATGIAAVTSTAFGSAEFPGSVGGFATILSAATGSVSIGLSANGYATTVSTAFGTAQGGDVPSFPVRMTLRGASLTLTLSGEYSRTLAGHTPVLTLKGTP